MVARKSKRSRKPTSKAHKRHLKRHPTGEMKLEDKIHKTMHQKKGDRFREVLIFLIKVNLFLIPLYLISYYRLNLIGLQRLVSRAVTGLLRASFVQSYLYDTFIKVPVPEGSFGAFISWDCTGWKSIIAFLALVFATPASKEKKLLGIALTPIIFFVNIIRVWFMFFFVYNYGLTYYDIVHHVLWSYGMILTVLVLWFVWYKWMNVPAGRNYVRKSHHRVIGHIAK